MRYLKKVVNSIVKERGRRRSFLSSIKLFELSNNLSVLCSNCNVDKFLKWTFTPETSVGWDFELRNNHRELQVFKPDSTYCFIDLRGDLFWDYVSSCCNFVFGGWYCSFFFFLFYVASWYSNSVESLNCCVVTIMPGLLLTRTCRFLKKLEFDSQQILQRAQSISSRFIT